MATARPATTQGEGRARPVPELPAVTARPAVTERSAEIRLVTDGERRFREALDASPDGFTIFGIRRSADGDVTGLELVFTNRVAALDLAGGDVSRLLGYDVRTIFPAVVETGVWDCLLSAASGGGPQRMEVDRSSWGDILDLRAVRLDDDTLLGTWHDITEERRRERLLTAAHAETSEVIATLQTALDATSDAFAVYALERDDAGRLDRLRLLLANVAAAAPMDVSPHDLVGKDVRDLFDQAVSSGLWNVIRDSVDELAPRHFRVHVLDDDGQWLTSWDNTIAPVGSERVVVTWRDATSDEKAVRELALAHDKALWVAEHDHLTGLPNRRLMLTRLAGALEEITAGERVAVVFVDLDDFKAINDTWGHAAGDEVLKAVGRRLSRIVRHGDTASRLAGDEFVLVLRFLQPDWDAEQFFHRAQAMVSAPVEIRGVQVMPHASMGLALSPPAEPDVDRLIQLADAAMYATKPRRRPSS